MNRDELTLRQQRLLGRSAALRADWTRQVQGVKRPLAVADRVRAAVQGLVRNPAWPLGGLLLLVVVRPGRVVVWGGRLWWAWKTYRQMGHWIARTPVAQARNPHPPLTR